MKRSKPVFIIGEAGVNHNGSLDQALRLIDAAVDSKVDAVKFQTFKARNVISKSAPKAEYQLQTTDAGESQLEMALKLEFDENCHEKLVQHCKDRGILFLSTPHDIESIDILTDVLDIPILKLGSGDLTNGPFLLKIARKKKKIILS